MQPAGGRLKRNLYWHHPAWFLLILISLWIYLIVMFIVRHTAKIEIGLCEIHRRKRWNAIAVSWLLVLAGIGAFCLGLALSGGLGPTPWYVPASIIGGIFMFLAGLIYSAIFVPLVAPQKIDKEYVWLKKIDPAYVAQFPPIAG